jgi:NAD+ kinase
MKTIGIFANCRKPSAREVLRRVADQARQHGLKLAVCDETARFVPAARLVKPALFVKKIDLLMAFGGDGTMLNAVRLLNGRDIPVLGVNLGSLGFLTSVSQEDVGRAIDSVASGKFSVSKRSMLECFVKRGTKKNAVYRALNDMVIDRGASSRVVTLNMAIEERDVSSFVGDGLIVSTPTGSTGHSLSAGGPILIPESRVFVICLICPHTLSTRPLVIPDNKSITVEVAKSAGDLILSVDGQISEPLKTGDRVEIRRSTARACFIHLPGYNYFSILRQKLHWRGSTGQGG